MKLGKLIGQGERSKVYQHPENSNLVIKVTKYSAEKKVLNYFFKNPSNFFVKIHDLFNEGNNTFAVLDKVENPDFMFTQIDEKKGRLFLGRFEPPITQTKEWFIENVISEQKHLVNDYFELIDLAVSKGCDKYDTAWNIGFLNGKMICFDTTIR